MPDGTIFYAKKDGLIFFKLEGRVTHLLAGDFEKAIAKTFDNINISGILFDMTETVYIDSTCLGIMAGVARRLRPESITPTIISSKTDEVNSTVHNMGFGQIFKITDTAKVNESSFEKIDKTEMDIGEKTFLMLKTHKELMMMNEKNNEEFKNVVKVLEAENKNINNNNALN
jgi:anti-anti-sigma factor